MSLRSNNRRYLFNPYTLLSCVARTTTTLDNTILLLAISSASSSKLAILDERLLTLHQDKPYQLASSSPS